MDFFSELQRQAKAGASAGDALSPPAAPPLWDGTTKSTKKKRRSSEVARTPDPGAAGRPGSPRTAAKARRLSTGDAAPPKKARKSDADGASPDPPARGDSRKSLQQAARRSSYGGTGVIPPSEPPPAAVSIRAHPFETEYGDHFETSSEALEDLAPVLRWLATRRAMKPVEMRVYDPYFCQGAVVGLLGRLGFPRVINRNRDFYADAATRNLPQYDVLVTNPPYSGKHKDKILEFCLGCGKPWALLLPNYVATKGYFRTLLERSSAPEPLFLVPAAEYTYSHPEGTGHADSPFKSVWIVGTPDKYEAEELFRWCAGEARGVRLARSRRC